MALSGILVEVGCYLNIGSVSQKNPCPYGGTLAFLSNNPLSLPRFASVTEKERGLLQAVVR